MTKIYEALEQADQERKGSKDSRSSTGAGNSSLKLSGGRLVENLISLYQNIVTMLPENRCRVVQFISSRRGEGTSTLSREFAKVVATELRKPVLLLDADQKKFSQVKHFKINPPFGWQEAAEKAVSVDQCLCRIDESQLHVSQVSLEGGTQGVVFDLPQIQGFLDEIRNQFELVVVDSPGALSSPDSMAMSAKVDGIILVVEAEKTRWQVAEKVIRRIVAQGGNVLGVILNKRRFPIPGFIYKWI